MYRVKLQDDHYNRMEFRFDDFEHMTIFLDYSIRFGTKVNATVAIESEEEDEEEC